jgi:hypothetical protein
MEKPDKAPKNNSYLSGVNSIIHNWNPAFECGDLEETEVSFPHMVEVHWRILPCVVFSNASIAVWNYLMAHGCTIGIYTLQEILLQTVV